MNGTFTGTKSRALALVLLLAPAICAQADDVTRLLATLDANKNGSLERTEFPGSDEQFAAIDANRNNSLSKAELAKSDLVRRYVAAMRTDNAAPRARVDTADLALRRLEALGRFDLDRDGRISRSEWHGDAGAFAELDLDGDGSLGTRDKELARRRILVSSPPPTLPDFKSSLEAPRELLRRLDADHDGRIGRREAAGHRLAAGFDWADRNRDDALDEPELGRLVGEVARQVNERNRGSGRIEAYRVPFSSWDADHDRRIELAEWKGPAYLFARIDSDRDAALTVAEVERYVRSVEGTSFLERFDLDDDGRVTLAEFGGPLGAFRRCDRNHDGVISSADR